MRRLASHATIQVSAIIVLISIYRFQCKKVLIPLQTERTSAHYFQNVADPTRYFFAFVRWMTRPLVLNTSFRSFVNNSIVIPCYKGYSDCFSITWEKSFLSILSLNMFYIKQTRQLVQACTRNPSKKKKKRFSNSFFLILAELRRPEGLPFGSQTRELIFSWLLWLPILVVGA